MAAEPHYIDVDLKKSTHYETTTVTQNDTDVVFILRVSDDGRSDESVLDNFSTVTLTSQRRDGQSFYVLGEKIPGTNEVRFALGTKELELTGKVSASAQLYSVDGRQSSAKFNYNVEGDLTGDYVPTETEATLIEIVLMDGPATIAEAEQVTAQTVEALELLETEKTVAFQELDDVKEDNKLTWKPEVATVALRNSTYPNPQNGDTVRITEEARIDRFNGTEWITTDRYNPNALDLVHQQLADKASYEEARLKDEKIELEDLSETTLGAMSGNTTFNLLSVPQNGSVSEQKLDFKMKRNLNSIEVLESDPTELWSGRQWIVLLPIFSDGFTGVDGAHWNGTKWRSTVTLNSSFVAPGSFAGIFQNKGQIKIATTDATKMVTIQKITQSPVVKVNEYREVEFEITDYLPENHTSAGFAFAICPTIPPSANLFGQSNWIRFFVGYEAAGRFILLTQKVDGTVSSTLYKQTIASDTGLKKYRFVFYNQNHYKFESFNGSEWVTLYETTNAGLAFTDGYIVLERNTIGTAGQTLNTSYVDNIKVKDY